MFERLRIRLSANRALPALALLGVCSGLLVGLVIILFRMLIETAQAAFLPGGQVENYEQLSPWLHFMVPLFGGLMIGLLFQMLAREERHVGIVHVIERLVYHGGSMPLRNAVVQFFGAAISIIAGHSVGREGPSVHLGAATGSLVGQALNLPNNALRTLVSCGVAAAIAASFNTPLAGVIFSMEVVVMGYSITSFAPVILAAVSATVLTRMVFGDDPAFVVPPVELSSVIELPYIIVMGVIIGLLAALFIRLLEHFSRLFVDWPVWRRMTLAGAIIGVCALLVPQIMGIGYDTVSLTLLGETGVWLMLGVVVFKLIATTAGLGLGLPGGLIGPTVVIGAAVGALMGMLAQLLFAEQIGTNQGLYAMIGMAAMMGATLQAPLAALTALLELTANPNVILPAMLAIITSGLTASELLGSRPVFQALLKVRGLDHRQDKFSLHLYETGVAAIMDDSVIVADRRLSAARAADIVEAAYHWVLVRKDKGGRAVLVPVADLAHYLAELAQPKESVIDLLALPAQSLDALEIKLQLNIRQALEVLKHSGVDALYVRSADVDKEDAVHGVLSQEKIDQYLRFGQYH